MIVTGTLFSAKPIRYWSDPKHQHWQLLGHSATIGRLLLKVPGHTAGLGPERAQKVSYHFQRTSIQFFVSWKRQATAAAIIVKKGAHVVAHAIDK